MSSLPAQKGNPPLTACWRQLCVDRRILRGASCGYPHLRSGCGNPHLCVPGLNLVRVGRGIRNSLCG